MNNDVIGLHIELNIGLDSNINNKYILERLEDKIQTMIEDDKSLIFLYGKGEYIKNKNSYGITRKGLK